MLFRYTVRVQMDDPSVATEWLAWMREGHLADVVRAGATSAEVIAVDRPSGGPAVFEARYSFDSRESFTRYEREHAPRLRAEGLARFPINRGVAYERSTGEVVAVTGQARH